MCLLRMICGRRSRQSRPSRGIEAAGALAAGHTRKFCWRSECAACRSTRARCAGINGKPLAGGDEGGSKSIKDVRIDVGDERLTLEMGCCCRGRRWGEEWKLLVVWPARIQERGLPGTCRGGPSWASAIRPPNFNLRKPCLDVCCSASALFHWHQHYFFNQFVQSYCTAHACCASDESMTLQP